MSTMTTRESARGARHLTKQRPSTTAVGIAGEHAVLAQLALRGFDAAMTLGNTKQIDTLVSCQASGAMRRLSVRTAYHLRPSTSALFGRALSWIMHHKDGTSADPDLFYCFVNIEAPDDRFRYFIVPNEIVATYVRESHGIWLARDGGTRVTPKALATTTREFRLGVGDGPYPLPTALASAYEERWDLLC
jgi:hypothetical protein